MQVYLVGGAVRDELLGRPVSERDWVVVGATPAQLEQQGYKAVGREFPVFLHPHTQEEHALARLERKTAPGYRGFAVLSTPEVTLEQDLQRRDLTINAMARAADGTLIDPYEGQRDIERRLLRHVSPAFVEDPVRVLRVARFAARFEPLGFRIAEETRALMRRMVEGGEINAVVPERLWREMERALGETNPEIFFDVLEDCGALPILLPELVWSEPARQTLQRSVLLSTDPQVRFTALLVDTDAAAIAALCARLHAPNQYRELALLAARLKQRTATAANLDAVGLLELLEAADALRRPARWQKLLLVVLAGAAPDGSASALLQRSLAAVAGVQLPREQQSLLQGPAIAAALRAARIKRLQMLQSRRRKS